MITSFSNPLVKQIKRLRQKKYRQEEGLFFIEGLRVVLTAVEQSAPLESLVYAPELLTSEVARQVIIEQQAQGVRCVSVAAAVFQAISERDNPAGLGAVVQAGWRPLHELPVTATAVYVALFDISDPGNLGTILRTLDATGASALILVGETADPFHSTAVKASMGALFTVPISQVSGAPTLLDWAGRHGIQTVATSAKATASYWAASYRRPLLLLMGNEGEGLPAAVMAAAGQSVTIPMSGTVSSLNLAVATSLLLYELRRRA
jgi:RNA methyltransferase, TrmH family